MKYSLFTILYRFQVYSIVIQYFYNLCSLIRKWLQFTVLYNISLLLIYFNFSLSFRHPIWCFPSHFLSLYWICYNIASVSCFGFFPWEAYKILAPHRDQTCTACIEKWSLNHWTAREVPPCMLLFALMGFACSSICIFLCLAFLSSFLHISGLGGCTSQHCASWCPYPRCLCRLSAPPETQWVQPSAFFMFSSVQLLSCVGLFATTWTAAC